MNIYIPTIKIWGNRNFAVVTLLFQIFFFNSMAQESHSELSVHKYKISDINIKGNFKTKKNVILSELLFNIDDEISSDELVEKINRSKENLDNTLLFNHVEIEYNLESDNEVIINVKVEERWYVWVFPLFELEGRNFADFLRVNEGDNFNYGIYIKHTNLIGGNNEFRFRFITGYRTQAILEYKKPAKNQDSGWGFRGVYQMYDKMAYSTLDNRQVFVKTRGSMLLEEKSAYLYYFYRYNMDHRHNVELIFSKLVVSDSLKTLKPNFLINDESSNSIMNVKYQYLYDKRDSKIYPLSGYDANLVFSYKGLAFDGTYPGFAQIQFQSSYQNKIYDRIYTQNVAKISLVDKKEAPYYFKTGFGYNEFINGFEYNVIDGNAFALLKNKIGYELIERKDYLLDWMPVRQFSRFFYSLFLNLNCDFGYVNNNNPTIDNIMANSLLMGYGLGLDFVTIYDQVWGVNYSFNNFGFYGLFFHINLSI